MKLLFICDYGQARSPLAAKIAEEIGHAKSIEIHATFFGLKTVDLATAQKLLAWADQVYVMEQRMQKTLQETFGYIQEVTVLDIPNSMIGDKRVVERNLRITLESYLLVS